MSTKCQCGGTGRRAGLIDNLSALGETLNVECFKFGESFEMVTPSQASEMKKV